MDRTKYLQLCRINAAYPKSRKVKYDGYEYYPVNYILGFDKAGQARHTAEIESANASQCHMFVKLSEVEEVEQV